MGTTITIVDIIIDRHHRFNLSDIASDLKRARIGGHDVLHVLVKDTNVFPKDEITLPHPYHSAMICPDDAPCRDDSIILEHQYIRNFNLQLVLDGAFYIIDQEVTDFELRPDVLVMLGVTMVAPQVSDHARVDLVKPWRK